MNSLWSLAFVFIQLLAFARGQGTELSSCCRRVPKVLNLGYDSSGRAIKLDVGRCSASCGQSGGTPLGKRYVSVLERIQQKKDDVTESTACLAPGGPGSAGAADAVCEPSAVHQETVADKRGPKTYEVTDECVCRSRPKSCERVAKLKRFFVGTEFEATVDVGQCVGTCKRGSRSCRSVRATSQAVMGPNGLIGVSAIAECKCAKSCYREHFNVAVTEQILDEATGQFQLATKLIDVGRCTGTCDPIERCVLRSNKKRHKHATKCLMALETYDVTCAPVRVRDVAYNDRHGSPAQVSQIRRCGCT